MKYTLEEIKQMLLEPSFDLEAQDIIYYEHRSKEAQKAFIMTITDLIEEAIKHHEKLNESNNGEGF